MGMEDVGGGPVDGAQAAAAEAEAAALKEQALCAAAAGADAGRCDDCEAAHARALLREVELRHAAEATLLEAQNLNVHLNARMQAAERERDAAIVERDARIADEALRAQRVDVEALRAKVEAMRKNLVAVDARADERYALDRRLLAENCEVKIGEVLAESREYVQQELAAAKAEVAAVRAEVQPAIDELAAVRAGEAVRAEAINVAMAMIWAFDRKDRGAARSHFDLLMHLRNVLSAARKEKQ